jgi:hypothetical protein
VIFSRIDRAVIECIWALDQPNPGRSSSREDLGKFIGNEVQEADRCRRDQNQAGLQLRIP